MKTVWRTIIYGLCISLFFGADIAYSAQKKKIKIKSVTIEGNHVFSDRRLEKVMVSRSSSFLNPAYYYPEIFDDDLKNLELFYHQQGYLDARITDHQVIIDEARRHAHIRMEIYEGEITHVEGVSVLGNSGLNDDILLRKINVRSGDVFKRSNIEDATLALATLYADSGYIDADVKPDVRIDSETQRALIDFNIQEKQQFRVGEIHINGLGKTKSNVLMRELKIRSGEIINYTLIRESQYNMYTTGLFQSVYIRPEPSAGGDSTIKDIRIDLRENMNGEFNVALGYGSIDRARGKVEVYNNNVGGKARKLGLAGKMSFITRSLEGSFTEPRTIGTSWRTDVNTFIELQEEPGYNLNRNGGKVAIGRTISKNETMTLAYRQEYTKISNIKLSVVPKEKDVNIRSLKLSLVRDFRDNLFNTTKGMYAELSTEVGGFYSSGVDRFVRSDFRLKYFGHLGKSTVVGSALDVGWMEAGSQFQSIPLQERYYAGGPNSLRAFDYQKVGPLDEKRVPLGGRLKVVFNIIEVRHSLYKRIGGALFAEAGNIWMNPGDFSLSDIRTAAGAGLRLNTPLGLARLDYGFNPDPRKGEPSGKLYFSMGQAF
ncbi:outer membrane protein assembly factor BamA [bacterium]|nr:outer membrane protein assembly factor BamA [bacterium]